MAGWTDGSERRLENILDGPVKFLHLEKMDIDAASRDADGVTVDGAQAEVP